MNCHKKSHNAPNVPGGCDGRPISINRRKAHHHPLGRGQAKSSPMAMARQEESPVMLSRSEASLCPAQQTFRCGSG